MWQMGGPGPMLGQVHHFVKYNKGKAPYAEERYLKEAHRLYGVLDRRLDGPRIRRRRLIRSPTSRSGRGSRASNGRPSISTRYPNVKRWYIDDRQPPGRAAGLQGAEGRRRDPDAVSGCATPGNRYNCCVREARRSDQGDHAMDDITRDPTTIRAEDINPRYNWGRHLPVLGTMGVDFEERVDYRRLHRYRLARARAALEASDLGALLLFDDNNIRYVTSTKIGEWARDKLSRWALLPRGGDPILWDFGSAAVHHKLYSPWLKPENCKAGLVGLRGTVDPAFGLMKHHAEEMASILKSAGVAQDADRRRHHRTADDVRAGEGRAQGQGRPAGHARSARGQIGRRDRAAQPRRGDGRRRLSADRREAEARRARE